MKKVLVVLICIIFSSFIMTAALAGNAFENAQTTLQTGGEQAIGETNSDLPTVIGRIVRAILVVMGMVLTIYVIRGGYMYMTAGGDTGQVTKAKEYLKNSIIGLVIIMLAYSISNYVLKWIITALAA